MVEYLLSLRDNYISDMIYGKYDELKHNKLQGYVQVVDDFISIPELLKTQKLNTK